MNVKKIYNINMRWCALMSTCTIYVSQFISTIPSPFHGLIIQLCPSAGTYHYHDVSYHMFIRDS